MYLIYNYNGSKSVNTYMIQKVQSKTSDNSFLTFPNAKRVKKGYLKHRYHNIEEADTFTKIRAAAGSVVGASIPLLYFAKKQHGKLGSLNQILRIDYGLKEFLSIGASAIMGGTAAGMLGQAPHKRSQKSQEAVFQFMNSAVPSIMIAGLFQLGKRFKILNNVPAKILSTGVGVVGGMYIGAELSNKINDPKDLYPDRKLTMQDAVANFDDVLGALVLAKFQVIEKVGAERLIPGVAAWCGYRAGTTD